MRVKIELLKKWCDDNINAMAWQRLGLELFDELSSLGVDFDHLDNHSESDQLSIEAFELIKSKISKIYQVEIEHNMVNA